MTPPGVSGMTGRPVHDIPVSPRENIFPACRLIFPVSLLENILPACRIFADPAKRSKEAWLHDSHHFGPDSGSVSLRSSALLLLFGHLLCGVPQLLN